jgi:RNA polymerase primary sigma factor
MSDLSQDRGHHLDSYFRDVRKTHPLSREEERRLASQIRRGDLKARNQLVTANLRFALDVAKRYQGRGLPLEDLISAANLGLLEAAKRFDGVNGVRFITYAVWWIRRYILKALAREQHLIHLPSHMVDLLSKVYRVSREMQQELERPPTMEEIAEQLDAPISLVQLAMASDRDVHSLDDDPQQGGEGSLLERIEDPESAGEPDTVERLGQLEEVDRLLGALTSREAEVVKRYYGLDGAGGVNLAEIGRALDLSRERVRQIKTAALKHLRLRARDLYRRSDYRSPMMNA